MTVSIGMMKKEPLGIIFFCAIADDEDKAKDKDNMDDAKNP